VLRRLQALSNALSDEQRRVVTEEMSDAELAVFDLLTKPAPELSDSDLKKVRGAARSLMEQVQDRLVLDWRRKADARAAVVTTIRDVLDRELPEVYDPDLYETKCDVVFEHIFAAFYDDGRSVYDAPMELPGPAPVPAAAVDVEQLTDDLIERIRTDAAFAEMMARQLRDEVTTWAVPTPALIHGEETEQVEFKSTARWNLHDQAKDKRMEDAVVKTVAGCLNGEGGTLLIGVDDSGTVLGLAADYECVKPSNGDGFVNWLTTHLSNAIGHAATMRTRIRVDTIDGLDVCRIDMARSSVPSSHARARSTPCTSSECTTRLGRCRRTSGSGTASTAGDAADRDIGGATRH
jgi:type I restriction enzyme R subunit